MRTFTFFPVILSVTFELNTHGLTFALLLGQFPLNLSFLFLQMGYLSCMQICSTFWGRARSKIAVTVFVVIIMISNKKFTPTSLQISMYLNLIMLTSPSALDLGIQSIQVTGGCFVPNSLSTAKSVTVN